MKKRIRTKAISFLLVLAMLMGWMPIPFGTDSQILTAEAAGDLSGTCGVNGEFTWTLTEDKEVDWDLNEGTPYKLTIQGSGTLDTSSCPWSANQETITSISLGSGITNLAGGFQGYPSLKSVSLPGLTEIPNNAFQYDSLLETITFGTKLTTIGNGAFLYCSSLQSVTLPASLTTVGEEAFSCCALTSVTCGTGLKVIGKDAFSFNSELAQVQFKSTKNLTEVGEGAFQYCSALESITLPGSVTTIGTGAFRYTGLTSFTVPKQAASIAEAALHGVRSLQTIDVASGNTSFLVENNVLYEKGTSGNPYRAIAYTLGSTEGTVNIADGTEVIDSYAFCEAVSITTVNFPDTLREIKSFAFMTCLKLKSLSFPDSMESVGDNAFEDCRSLTDVVFGTGLREFGIRVFDKCKALKTIEIAEENTYFDAEENIIYDKAHTHLYFYLPNKADVVYQVPETVESMSSYAICAATALKELYMPVGMKNIPDCAITDNSALNSIYFPGDAPTLASASSIQKNASSLIIFRNPSSLGWDGALWKSYKMADWDPDNTRVEEGTFDGVSWKYKADEERLSFTGSGEIPDFTSDNPAPWSEYMDAIQTVDTASISGIGDSSFCQAEKLIRLETDGAMKRIGSHAFADCGNLCFINILGVEEIGIGAFENDISLTGVMLTKAQTIASQAFKGCTAITDVAFGIFLTSLEEEVFAGCTVLDHVIVTDSVAAIKSGAFKDCVSLRTINIPAGVAEIGSMVFSGDAALEKVYFYGAIPEKREDDSFAGCSRSLTIYYRKSQASWEVLGGAWNGVPVQGQDKFYTEQQDHYSFSNSADSFGYKADYRIPRQRYVDVMKNITTGSYYYAIDREWGGSCYGMASSTLEFYENPDVNVEDYDASAQNLYGVKAPEDKDAPLTKLIEAYQVSQYKPVISGAYGSIVQNMEDYKGLVLKVEEFERSGGLSVDSNAEPVVLALYDKFTGHAVIPVSVEQDSDGNYLMEIYDPNFPFLLQTVAIKKDFSGICDEAYTYASYIPYSSVAGAMEGVQLYSDIKDNSLYLSIDKENGNVTDTQGKGIEQIEGAYEQKGFHAAQEDVFTGIKSFVLPRGNYQLTAKTDTEDTENTGEEEEQTTFYLASEENFAIISSSDEDAVLEVRQENAENDELQMELQSDSQEKEISSFTIMNDLGMERTIEVDGNSATVKVAKDDTITIEALDAENVSIDGKEIERNNGQAVSSFVATSEENPLKVDDIETSVVCGADNKLNGTVSATVISNAASAKNVTVTADYYEVRSGKKAASYAKEVQLEAGMNMESFSFENLETEFSETEGLVPMFCKLTVTDEDGNSVDGTVDGITVTLTKKTDPTDPIDPEVAVEKIIVMPEELTLLVGESAQLKATVLPENASDKKLVYTALNGNVSVTQDGKVTANRVGTSRISISSSNGKNAVVSVTVKEKTGLGDTGKPDGTEVAVTGVSVKPAQGTFGVGESFQIKASVLPENASDKALTFTASNDNVTVSPTGVVTTKKAGSSCITVRSSNGKYAVTNVIVKNAPSKVTLNAKKKTLKVGKTFQIKVKLSQNAASSRISYSSNKKSVAVVSSSGKVTARKKGTAVITVKTHNGKFAKLNITVKKDIPVKKVTVKKKKLVLKVGQTVRLKVSILPKNATDKRVSYKSSNKNVKVSKKGYVTGKKAGKTKITIKSMNGKKTVVNVTVKKDQTRLVFLLD